MKTLFRLMEVMLIISLVMYGAHRVSEKEISASNFNLENENCNEEQRITSTKHQLIQKHIVLVQSLHRVKELSEVLMDSSYSSYRSSTTISENKNYRKVLKGLRNQCID